MLILGTLVVTWIAHNWWKLLLLLVAIIVIHEYKLHKKHAAGADDPDKAEADVSESADANQPEDDAAKTADSE